MICFACHRHDAQFQDASNGLGFCNEVCQQSFYINGTFETLLNQSNFDVKVFVDMLNQYIHLADKLKFINGLLEDATKEQRNRIIEWLLTNTAVSSSLFILHLNGKDMTKRLFSHALVNEFKSILRYLPLDALTSRKFAKRSLNIALTRQVSIETLRILMTRFMYTVGEFIDDGISSLFYANISSAYAIGILKIFGTILNETGKEVTLQFIKTIETGNKYMEYTLEYNMHILRAYRALLYKINVPIEPDPNVKKIKMF